jgi:hypothetical protein
MKAHKRKKRQEQPAKNRIDEKETKPKVNGRLFKKGNPGGPGRPKRATEKKYLEAVIAGCPLYKWRRIIEVAARDAMGGDKDARNWLAKYLVGDDTIATLGKDQPFDLGVLVPIGFIAAPQPTPPARANDPVPA